MLLTPPRSFNKPKGGLPALAWSIDFIILPVLNSQASRLSAENRLTRIGGCVMDQRERVNTWQKERDRLTERSRALSLLRRSFLFLILYAAAMSYALTISGY